KKEKGAAEFFALKHGLEGLVQALVQELEGCEDRPPRPRERAGNVGIPACELRNSASVRQCDYNAGWNISMEDGTALRADILGLAMNACDSSELLSTTAPGLSRELSAIRYDSIATVNLIFKSEDVPDRGMKPGFLVPMGGESYPFSSLKWLGRSADGKYHLMRTFLSETMNPKVFSDSDEVLKQKTLIFLSDFLGIQAKPLFIDVNRYPKALPQYETGHLERVARIEKETLQCPGLFLTGNSFRGFGITDCIRQSRLVVSSLQSAGF
ncbi:MAG: FAD-dependent oxidoreductase, partial [Candidatus Omnitrophica bacterium]|nr:FAD-dependent oxidoreductase [Candidatus Omnitrophota bacterium]